MKKITEHPLMISLLLLAVSLLGYGALILKPGFFGDDVSLLWLFQRSGLAGLQAYFGVEGSLPALLTSGLIGAVGWNAWIYQLLAVLLRWLGAWSLWLLLNEVWPKNEGKAFMATLIFLIFPGMKHLPLAISIFPHLLALCLTITGFSFLHHAITDPERRRLHYVASWLTGIAMLLSHYFIGLEVVRILLIWRDWRKEKGIDTGTLLRRTFLTWTPFAFFLGLRIGLGFPASPAIGDSLPAALMAAGKSALRNLLDMLVLVWRQVFQIPQETGVLIGFLLAVIIAGLLVFLGLSRLRLGEPVKEKGKTGNYHHHREYLLIGLITLLAGGLPVWLGREALSLTYPDSIAALAFLPGVAILTAGVLDLLLLPRFQAALAAVLVALSVGAQYQNSSSFVEEWQQVGKIAWQLNSRLPAIPEGTILVSEQVPLDTYSQENLTALLNLMYFPDRHGSTEGLLYLDAKTLAAAPVNEGLIENADRGFRFAVEAAHSMAFYQPEKGCLRVLDPGNVDPAGVPHTLGQVLAKIEPLKGEPSGKGVSLPTFIPPVENLERCLILEKIERANRQGDWEESARLLNGSLDTLRVVSERYELAPLVETAAHAGQADLVRSLSLENMPAEGGPYELCRTFSRLEEANGLSIEVKRALEVLKIEALCENYD
jgi:hypothetical protein